MSFLFTRLFNAEHCINYTFLQQLLKVSMYICICTSAQISLFLHQMHVFACITYLWTGKAGSSHFLISQCAVNTKRKENKQKKETSRTDGNLKHHPSIGFCPDNCLVNSNWITIFWLFQSVSVWWFDSKTLRKFHLPCSNLPRALRMNRTSPGTASAVRWYPLQHSGSAAAPVRSWQQREGERSKVFGNK